MSSYCYSSYKAPNSQLPAVNDDDVKEYERKYLGRWNIPEVMKNMVFAELETSVPTFTARKVGTVHYLPDAKKIIFKGPATIILWADKTKTVVKCMDGDVYDPEKAVLMAYLEKIAGGKGPAKRFLKDCLKDYTPQTDIETILEKPHFENAYDLDYSTVYNFNMGAALNMLGKMDNEEKVQIIRRALGTMTCSEAAKALGISESTVRRVRKKKENEV